MIRRDIEAAWGDLVRSVVAARLFAHDACSDASDRAVRRDEDDWAESALFHAAKCLALGGQPAASAALLPRLAPEDRAEIESLLGAVDTG